MIKRKLHFILLILLAADIAFSFSQYYNTVLDGDMANTILRTNISKSVFEDPFGLSAFSEHKKYSAPNRYFAYWSMSSYFKIIPVAAQYFTDPIDSIYLSCAIIKTAIQILIIYLLSVFISGKSNVLRKEFLVAAILVTPLFQSAGYNRYMGIIDPSITYTFFYALPLSLLLVFFLPFFLASHHEKKIRFTKAIYFFLFVLIIFLSFNGPLIPGVVLIICPMTLIYYWRSSYKMTKQLQFTQRIFSAFKEIPTHIKLCFILFCMLSVYSLYIGKYNAENYNQTVTLTQRYALLPAGLYYPLTQSSVCRCWFL